MTTHAPRPTPHIPGRLLLWEHLNGYFHYLEDKTSLPEVLNLNTGTRLGIMSLQAERYQLHCYKFTSEPGVFGINIQQKRKQSPLVHAAFVMCSRVETQQNVMDLNPADYLLNLVDNAQIDTALSEEHAAT